MLGYVARLGNRVLRLFRRNEKAQPLYRYNRLTGLAEQWDGAGWVEAGDQLVALLVIATRQTRPADNLTRLAAGVLVPAGRRIS